MTGLENIVATATGVGVIGRVFPDLVTTSDPDWAAFQNQDPAFYMRLAQSEIRRYCGWHIFPSIDVTLTNLPVEAKGIISLPSMMVTDVASVALQDPAGGAPVALDPSHYTWYSYGTIEPANWNWWGGYGGYYYGPDTYAAMPVTQFGLATVEFTHGYTEVPDDIKGVAFELVTTTLEVNAGNIKEIQTPGFKLQPSQPFGASLNQQQENRLAKYRVPAVK